MTPFALIRRCDVCGNINAIDLDGSIVNEAEMRMADHTVTRVSEVEAMEASKLAVRCDHKKLVEQLRAEIAALKS